MNLNIAIIFIEHIVESVVKLVVRTDLMMLAKYLKFNIFVFVIFNFSYEFLYFIFPFLIYMKTFKI